MAAILNRDLVEHAFESIRPAVSLLLRDAMPDRAGVAVVVAATEAIDPTFRSTGEAFRRACYLVSAIGDIAASPYPNIEIALSKAELSARTGRPTASLPPHYLRPGDTVFWGSAVLDGIVVACAGLEPRHDEMIAYWVAAAVQAECRHALETQLSAKPTDNFLDR